MASSILKLGPIESDDLGEKGVMYQEVLPIPSMFR